VCGLGPPSVVRFFPSRGREHQISLHSLLHLLGRCQLSEWGDWNASSAVLGSLPFPDFFLPMDFIHVKKPGAIGTFSLLATATAGSPLRVPPRSQGTRCNPSLAPVGLFRVFLSISALYWPSFLPLSRLYRFRADAISKPFVISGCR